MSSDDVLLPHFAVASGLGEQGRTGLFIDYTLGPTVRLAAVTTNAEFDIPKLVKRGINEFCHRCRYCVNHSPPKALPDRLYLNMVGTGREVDFKIKFQQCFQYFKEHHGCGRCIVNCIQNLIPKL